MESADKQTAAFIAEIRTSRREVRGSFDAINRRVAKCPTPGAYLIALTLTAAFVITGTLFLMSSFGALPIR